MILSDRDIRALCDPDKDNPLITPFSECVEGDVISYGLTSAGYDMRLGYEFLIYKASYSIPVDPKRFKEPGYQEKMFDKIALAPTTPLQLPPHGYALTTSREWFNIPRNLKGITIGKSTYARIGILINVTPAEPGWSGRLTIEIANLSPVTATLYPGEGIAQMEFHVLSSDPEVCYADKKGKYQNQTDVTPPRMK